MEPTTIQNIPLNMIVVSPMNPRKTIDQASLEELADNIKRQGLLQPITVRPKVYDDIPAKYEIVCGERRFRAVFHNGSETIPCIVREMTDDEAFEAAITENLQRKDVDPIEEAFAFAQLYSRGKSVEEISNRFGKSAKFIRERIKLDGLLPELKQLVSKELMHIGAAIHIAKLAEDEQRKFLEDFEIDEDDDMEDLEPITKEDAVSFTDKMFKRIASADWNESYLGPCGCTCDKCEFNNANEGCLFNDMKVAKDDACCTSHDRWYAKRLAWFKGVIDKHADAFVKQGEELTPGKMVLAHSDSYYGTAEDYKELKEYCTIKGYLLVDVGDMFERWPNLRRDDEDTRRKLANGEAYMVMLLDSDYRGACVDIKCFALRKPESKEGSEAAKVSQLLRDLNANIVKSKGEIANEMRKAVADYDLNAISWKALTDVEWEIFLTLLISQSPCNVKDAIMGRINNEAGFAKEHNTAEGRDDIIRKWLRGKLSDSGVQYYPIQQKCQARLIEVWGIDDVEVKGRAAANLRKKQDKIEKELTRLGYDTEGKKLDF